MNLHEIKIYSLNNFLQSLLVKYSVYFVHLILKGKQVIKINFIKGISTKDDNQYHPKNNVIFTILYKLRDETLPYNAKRKIKK